MIHSFTPISYATIPRSAIEQLHYTSIDVSLKGLRQASRRVTAFSTPYQNELRLLERIYYKGKNQHRSALFWRKVSETLRLSKRIHGVNFIGFVEELRYAFYGVEVKKNSKVLHGAWKQTPDRDSCLSLLRRLRSACLLVDQARVRFRKAYGAFTRQIQTTAFLPLTISLLSITSRLDFLVSELREIIGMVWKAVARILELIAERGTIKCCDVQLPLDPLGLAAVMASPTPGATPGPKRSHRASITIDIAEDFGSILPRESFSNPASLGQTSTDANMLPAHSGGLVTTSSWATEIPIVLSTHNVLYKDSDIMTSISHTKGIPESCSPIEASPSDHEGCSLMQGRAGNRQKMKKSKRVKRQDEIDDIFGF